jgi:hypothetical protein
MISGTFELMKKATGVLMFNRNFFFGKIKFFKQNHGSPQSLCQEKRLT